MTSVPEQQTRLLSGSVDSGINNKTKSMRRTSHKNKMMITKTLTRTTVVAALVVALFMSVVMVGTASAAAVVTAETSGKAIPAHPNWAQNDPAKFYVTKYDAQGKLNHQHKFDGNQSSFFKILHQDEDSILVGGRNTLFNLSLDTLQERPNTRIVWYATDAHRQLCMLKGKAEQECQNYIRVYGGIGEKQFLLCGTNAYKPQCREYNAQRNVLGKSHQTETDLEVAVEDVDGNEDSTEVALEYENEEEAQGRCPYNPQHSSSYVFADGQLYSGTVADFSSGDPLIYRKPQRTEQYDLSQLNQPDFISSFEYKEFVYFFFRENAIETMNCGPTIYSRVARICKNDKGGPYQFNNRWTSFVKTRLNCSIPGDYPFYFNELKATSRIINTEGRSGVVYAVFQTPENSIPGSAVCAFDFDDIEAAFNGRFKGQKDSNSNWMTMENTPEPHPSQCVEDSRTMSSNAVNFIRKHPLMETSASPALKRPSLTTVGNKHRLTAIAVDPQVTIRGAGAVDMIYVGTDDGRVIKFFNQEEAGEPATSTLAAKPVIVSDVQVLPPGTKITELSISKKTDSLIVVSNGAIVSTTLNSCEAMKACDECVRVPGCAWDMDVLRCVMDRKPSKSHLYDAKYCSPRSPVASNAGRKIDTASPSRGTVSGVGPLNGFTAVDSNNEITMTSINDSELNILTNDPGQYNPADSLEGNQLNTYTAQTMASSVVLTSIASLIVGLVVGIYLSRRRCHNNPFMDPETRNHWHTKPSRTSGKDVNLLMNTNHLYPQGPPAQLMSLNIHNNNQHPMNNLQGHGSPKKDNLDHDNFDMTEKDRTQEYKNSTESLDKDIMHNKMGTLQKVKKTYI